MHRKSKSVRSDLPNEDDGVVGSADCVRSELPPEVRALVEISDSVIEEIDWNAFEESNSVADEGAPLVEKVRRFCFPTDQRLEP